MCHICRDYDCPGCYTDDDDEDLDAADKDDFVEDAPDVDEDCDIDATCTEWYRREY